MPFSWMYFKFGTESTYNVGLLLSFETRDSNPAFSKVDVKHLSRLGFQYILRF